MREGNTVYQPVYQLSRHAGTQRCVNGPPAARAKPPSRIGIGIASLPGQQPPSGTHIAHMIFNTACCNANTPDSSPHLHGRSCQLARSPSPSLLSIAHRPVQHPFPTINACDQPGRQLPLRLAKASHPHRQIPHPSLDRAYIFALSSISMALTPIRLVSSHASK